MSFIGAEEGGKLGGREEEVRRRLDKDGRRANDEDERGGKGNGRSKRSQTSNELRGCSEQKSGSVASAQKLNWKELGRREVTSRKDDKSVKRGGGSGGGEEELRRVPYLQVSNCHLTNSVNVQPSDKIL